MSENSSFYILFSLLHMCELNQRKLKTFPSAPSSPGFVALTEGAQYNQEKHFLWEELLLDDRCLLHTKVYASVSCHISTQSSPNVILYCI